MPFLNSVFSDQYIQIEPVYLDAMVTVVTI